MKGCDRKRCTLRARETVILSSCAELCDAEVRRMMSWRTFLILQTFCRTGARDGVVLAQPSESGESMRDVESSGSTVNG